MALMECICLKRSDNLLALCEMPNGKAEIKEITTSA
jgi:hypothetical protein